MTAEPILPKLGTGCQARPARTIRPFSKVGMGAGLKRHHVAPEHETKPDGTPRKLLEVSRLNGLRWRPITLLNEGIERTYAWLLLNTRLVEVGN